MSFTHPVRHPISDAGDPVTSTVMGRNSRFNAFQYTLTFEYLTMFFFLNESDTNATQFIYDDVTVPDFTPVTSITETPGTVAFYLDEFLPGDAVTGTLVLILTNNIRTSQEYEVPFTVDWNSLPFGYSGGRTYNYSGILTVPIPVVSIRLSYITSNILTPDPEVQVQEEILANITVVFPEV